MQRAHVHALVAQRAEQLVAADLGAHEDDRLVGLLGAQHLDQLRRLLARLDRRAGTARRCRSSASPPRPRRPAGRRGSGRRARGSAAASSPRRAPSGGPTGVAARIFSTSSRKPRSSISSASSSTTKRQSCSSSEPRVTRSRTRPTVPTTTWPPPRSCASWLRIGAPPKTATTSTLARRAVGAQRLRDLDAQLARRRQHERLHVVERRGRRTRSSAARRRRSCRCRSAPARSRRGPPSSGGIACSWIGLGDS